MPSLLGPVTCPFCGHTLQTPHKHLVRKHKHPRSKSRYLAVYRCPRCGKMFTIARRRLKVILEGGDVRYTLIFRPIEERLEIYLERLSHKE